MKRPHRLLAYGTVDVEAVSLLERADAAVETDAEDRSRRDPEALPHGEAAWGTAQLILPGAVVRS